MRKIRLSDKDIEFFDLEVSPAEFVFFQKHKDAFRCMWKEQGKDFWTKFTITFRSFTVKHGVIKQMSCDAPKFENMVDQAFIYIHEQFVEGKESIARRFIEDTARLAQNHDKFPHLDSKSFSKDPFYSKDTRDLFRGFFGNPDQKSSYVKVYVLSPIYLRFGGSVCRCLRRWMDAPPHDCKDDSYWIPPTPQNSGEEKSRQKVIMCTKCLDDCGTMYFRERLCGLRDGPKFLDYWRLGDPRFNDSKNPLFDSDADRDSDWRDGLAVEDFQDFVHYAKFKYGKEDDKCSDCLELDNKKPSSDSAKNENGETEKKKKKKKKKTKEKSGETGTNGEKDEVQKLVDHITGKCTLDVMPVNTKAGASAEGEVTGITENMISQAAGENAVKRKRRGIFSNKARITDGFKPGILSGSDEISTGEVVGGFKVIKIEDERTGAKEIKIKVRALKPGDDNDMEMIAASPLVVKSAVKQPLAAELLKRRIDNMPSKLEWWEGSGWCAVVINYEEEEKHITACPTNFTLKISGHEEYTMKRVMLKLLFYVSRRKRRPCPGWIMDDDDVIACILPDETTDQDGLTICIQRGFRFQDGLSEEEKETIMMPSDIESRLTVLLALDGGLAEAVAKGPFGRHNLKRLIERISGRCLSESDSKKVLTKKLKEKGKILEDDSAEGDDKFDNQCEMWKQIVNEPKSFEMLIQVNARRVEELEELGLRPVDLDLVYSTEDKRNTTIPLQKTCHKCERSVYYCNCFDRSIYNNLLQCNCRKCKVDKPVEQKAPKSSPEKKAVKESPKDGKGKVESKSFLVTDIQITLGEKNTEAGNEKSKLVIKENTYVKDEQVHETDLHTYLSSMREKRDSHHKQVQQFLDLGIDFPPDLRKMVSEKFQADFIHKDGTPIVNPEEELDEALDILSDKLDIEAQESNQGKEGENEILNEEEKMGDKKKDMTKSSEKKDIGDLLNIKVNPERIAQAMEVNTKKETEAAVDTKIEEKKAGDSKKEAKESKDTKKEAIDNKKETKGTLDDKKEKQEAIGTKKKTQEAVHTKKGTKESVDTKAKETTKVLGPESLLNNAKALEEIQNRQIESQDADMARVALMGGIGQPITGKNSPKSKLKNCASCGTLEPAPRTFKKCQKCKQEGITGARYYCGRDCQVQDWAAKHKREHKEKILI